MRKLWWYRIEYDDTCTNIKDVYCCCCCSCCFDHYTCVEHSYLFSELSCSCWHPLYSSFPFRLPLYGAESEKKRESEIRKPLSLLSFPTANFEGKQKFYAQQFPNYNDDKLSHTQENMSLSALEFSRGSFHSLNIPKNCFFEAALNPFSIIGQQ